MDKQVLRDYLEQIRLLETDIYTMQKSIQLLQESKKAIPTLHLPTKPRKADDPVLHKPSTTGTVAGTVGLAMLGYLPAVPYLAYRLYKTKKAKDEYNAKVESNQREYDKALAEYNKTYSEREKEHALMVERVNLYNANLDTQITALHASKEATEVVLNRLYDLDIIYKKYRSLVPISMFCEYLDSGLRTELHGTNGMYDLYERQLVGQQIVGELSAVNSNLNAISYKLSNLSSQLSGIQRNQILLYDEVARGNDIAQEIKLGTEKLLSTCESRLSAIQNATEVTAQNAKMEARRTDAIARIAEYEFAVNHSPYINP